MSTPKSPAKGADWTRLLADPDLATHLGELLRVYRESPPETREQALLDAMKKIKWKSAGPDNGSAVKTPPEPVATPAPDTPPFEPSIFTPSWAQDRRRYPRMKCFVVVEMRVSGSENPIWGNLSNTSLGGCFVETPSTFVAGTKVEIGLWLASGQIWIKGLVLNGIVAHNNPSFGIRIRFADLETSERETLRQFLKFVETATKGYAQENGYLAQLKR